MEYDNTKIQVVAYRFKWIDGLLLINIVKA